MNCGEVLWKPVVGYEGHYEVSSTGLVRSLHRVVETKGGWFQSHPSKMLKLGTANSTGHKIVMLSREGKPKPFLVHRLVLEAFSGPRPEGMWACHNNDVGSDNRIENLRWDTPTSNMRDAFRNGRRVSKTHCKRGHKFTDINTYITVAGGRQCRTCIKITRKSRGESK